MRYKDALIMLTFKEIKLRYTRSRLGLLWTLIEPLGIILIYSLVFPLLLNAEFFSWVSFFIAGLLPYRFFSSGLLSATESMVKNRETLNNVNIPAEIIPISSVLSRFIIFIIEFLIFFTILILAGVPLSIFVLLLPVLFVIEFALVLGVGFIFSLFHINSQDILHGLNLLLLALFFLTPMIYRPSIIPSDLQGLYFANPLSRLIVMFQSTLLYGTENYIEYLPLLENVVLLGIFSFAVLGAGYLIFNIKKQAYVGEI